MVEVIEYITYHLLDARFVGKRLFGVDTDHLGIRDLCLATHGVNVVDLERQHVAVFDGIDDSVGMELVAKDLRRTMQAHCGVFRFPDLLSEGVTKIKAVAERAARTGIKDKSKVFNTARVEALELDNLIEVARSTMISADARKESRGAHDRADCHDTPENPNGRNDKEWLKHTMWYRDGDRLEYKAVNLQPMSTESIELKVRSY